MMIENKKCLRQLEDVLQNEKNTPAGDKLINLVESSRKEFFKFIERNKIDLSQNKDKIENGTEE